MFITIFVVGF